MTGHKSRTIYHICSNGHIYIYRLLQENKKYKENEGARWAELQRKKCQAIHKSVICRAKAMDPHKSLEETHKEKLKQNWYYKFTK